MDDKVHRLFVDMDGTLADLFGVENWLEKIRAYDPTPYQTAEPLVDMAELGCLLRSLQNCGINVAVITWLSKEPNKQYDDEVRKAKRAWLKEYGWDLGGAIDPTKVDILEVLKEILNGLE